jgi:hypothetical protein
MSIFWRIRLYILQEFKIKYDQRTEKVTETCRCLFNDDVCQALYSRIVGGPINNKLGRIRKGVVVATSMYYRGISKKFQNLRTFFKVRELTIQSIVRYCMVWYGMVWYGMVWYGMLWYSIV